MAYTKPILPVDVSGVSKPFMRAYEALKNPYQDIVEVIQKTLLINQVIQEEQDMPKPLRSIMTQA